MKKYFHMFHIDKSDICTLKNPKVEMIEKLSRIENKHRAKLDKKTIYGQIMSPKRKNNAKK